MGYQEWLENSALSEKSKSSVGSLRIFSCNGKQQWRFGRLFQIDLSGFHSVEFKGVNVDIIRNTPHVTDNGWIGPDHPSTATEEWGKEMLETTANYIVDFMEEFKKIKLS